VLEEPGLALVFNAPIDLILSDQQVLQPDLAIVRTTRQQLVTERGLEGPPDIVAEILSPSTRVLDQRVKKGVCARFGVPEYWLVDPVGGHIEQWRLAGPDYRLEKHFDRASRLSTPSFSEVDIDLQRVFRS
jgi:Uma2 family endonuclease